MDHPVLALRYWSLRDWTLEESQWIYEYIPHKGDDLFTSPLNSKEPWQDIDSCVSNVEIWQGACIQLCINSILICVWEKRGIFSRLPYSLFWDACYVSTCRHITFSLARRIKLKKQHCSVLYSLATLHALTKMQWSLFISFHYRKDKQYTIH